MIQNDKSGIAQMMSVVIDKGTVYLPFAELVDVAKEMYALQKRREKADGRTQTLLRGMLGNPNFCK